MSKLKEIQSHLADIIFDMRRKKGWSQQKLALKLNTSRTQVWRLEKPKATLPSIGTLVKLAIIFKKDLVIEFVERN